MLMLSNDDVSSVLKMPDTIDALRLAYLDLGSKRASHVPLIYLYYPIDGQDEYYRSGTTVGGCGSGKVVAVRIKSDVISWAGGRESKYCIEPGTYCGLILVFSAETGEPLAILNDGYLQHYRIGAMVGLGADVLARKDAEVVGVVGSGGMARTGLVGLSAVRSIREVKVYSPNVEHRNAYATEMSATLNLEVRAVDTVDAALSGADIVLSATDSTSPTLSPALLERGSHVTYISRREIDSELMGRADALFQLETSPFTDSTLLPGMEWSGGAIPAFICGDEEQRARVPRRKTSQQARGVPLSDVMSGESPGRTSHGQITALLLDGTQGLQFGAVAALAVREAHRAGVGRSLPTELFLQDIRD